MTRERMYEILKAYTAKKLAYDTRELTPVLEALEEEIRAAAAKRGGKSNYLKLANSLIKSCDQQCRTELAGSWPTPSGFGYCDGYRGLIVKTDLGHEAAAAPFTNLETLFDNLERENLNVTNLPDAGEIKISLSEQKSRGIKSDKAVYTIPGADRDVNASWLLEIVQNMPNASMYYNPDAPMGPILFTDEEAKYLLLPMRK